MALEQTAPLEVLENIEKGFRAPGREPLEDADELVTPRGRVFPFDVERREPAARGERVAEATHDDTVIHPMTTLARGDETVRPFDRCRLDPPDHPTDPREAPT